MKIGIRLWGTYVPTLRLPASEVREAWGQSPGGNEARAVPDFDEDAVTMGIAAAGEALGAMSELREPPALNWHLGIASTSLPRAEGSSTGVLSRALGLGPQIVATEHTTSWRAGTEALLTARAYLTAGLCERALVVASDAPRIAPADDPALATGAAAVALVLDENPIVVIEEAATFADEFPGIRFRGHGEAEQRDLGVTSYARDALAQLVEGAVRELQARCGVQPGDFERVILPAPGGSVPPDVIRKLGISPKKVEAPSVYRQIGETGTTTSFLELLGVLRRAETDERILWVSWGAGGVCDAMALRVVSAYRPDGRSTAFFSAGRESRQISYLTYLRLKGFLK